jgi:RHH-type rel operon transcriptional repressor/antitoxin RelB
MAVSVRMDPLLERELEFAAQRQGITKSQFIVQAVERALGRKNPYELMMKLKVEEEQGRYGPLPAIASAAPADSSYDTEASRARMLDALKAKHGVGGAG